MALDNYVRYINIIFCIQLCTVVLWNINDFNNEFTLSSTLVNGRLFLVTYLHSSVWRVCVWMGWDELDVDVDDTTINYFCKNAAGRRPCVKPLYHQNSNNNTIQRALDANKLFNNVNMMIRYLVYIQRLCALTYNCNNIAQKYYIK